ncbi:phosphomevalonate kinase, putative [Candida dubliniensis CD36]|uniref:Phosphomevalonate kinase n=1 Tax=Candida dubliniensis (strain CD36 / ATCC MYA-646 / CBS 7987 / NCPF 3949 / NRRL Y-17841) TaxID=573826 RepID=B9WFN7_CANDC|nr:phosphomevalonate kinase, putative [Candida dubliniensis CD36]CAX42056.1 phosphomevalonate kinase, putative [Candida dubliniensis CD36]
MSKAFSAPGKAFLAGGYLVLEPIYDAYVTALSSRMHAVITPKTPSLQEESRIKISSPQFANGEWEYHISSNTEKPKEVQSRLNPFLEATIFIVLAYIQPIEPFDLEIVIYSDPGYHSQEDTKAKTSLNEKNTFLYHSRVINEVEKTGLGSSAGLVSVVATSLLSHFIPNVVNEHKDILHNVAQIAHCYAQKKIGSGFDVATAIYGSIIYRRFQPALINEVFQVLESDPEKFPTELKKLIESNWEFKHERCTLPYGIKLLMGDVKGGSETPKLVSRVLQWKKEKPEESSVVYDQLNAANLQFMKELREMCEKHNSNPEAYIKDLDHFVEPLTVAMNKIRKGLQTLTQKSEVPIEPAVQTELLDRCQEINGCVGGVVPGAGGYDAIAVLVLESEVENFKQKTLENPDYFHNVYWVDLEEQTEGVLEEKLEDYVGL